MTTTRHFLLTIRRGILTGIAIVLVSIMFEAGLLPMQMLFTPPVTPQQGVMR